ncbi:MAG: biotin--[acetyl-CoA-carboxylase] ligase [Treponema sp.]|jgi:BirA family biotin operon repressor/biotin-[acetyl-CoA-carboxylase] ligase|nr:biotin--[acetyl-CoA-carboxylase] ligase [Treponema sp.]
MKRLDLANPFGAPVYHLAAVSSTMDEARRLAGNGAAHGTVVAADFQQAGRGRVPSRPWIGRSGENLFATILLRYPGVAAIPRALTLKTGLAAAQAIEDFAPSLAGTLRIKWPNDLMIRVPGEEAARKTAGILTESDGSAVFIGIGVNVLQTEFPEWLRHKATSIALARRERGEEGAAGGPAEGDSTEDGPAARFSLLALILARLYRELAGKTADAGRDDTGGGDPWRGRLEERLYLKGERVRFIAGGADSGRIVEGRLAGVGEGGELLIVPDAGAGPLAFVTGELDVYGAGDPSAGA